MENLNPHSFTSPQSNNPVATGLPLCSDAVFFMDKINRRKLSDIRKSMIYRCYNTKNKDYGEYGGRGITVCDDWLNDVNLFLNWAVSNGYKSGLQIDRCINDGNYEPSNCRWVTRYINQQNRRHIFSQNKTGFRGVSKRGIRSFQGRIKSFGKLYLLGSFPTPELAAQAYNDFVIEHKTFHTLNIIENNSSPQKKGE